MSRARAPSRPLQPDSRRAQSNPIGLILVMGLVVAGASAVVVLGADALGDTQQSLSDQRAEKIMTQLDSKSALVALGNTETQRVVLPQSGSVSFEVRDDGSWMNLSVKNETSGEVKTIVNHTLGQVVYESESGTTIAYQGGGVWRSEPDGEAMMISPPEFHYRGATLTLPVVAVDGDRSLSNQAWITNLRETQHFPNKSDDPDFVNPLDRGAINATVHSDYYMGWGKYFEARTEGNVVYDHENETVIAELAVPFDENVRWAVATTQANGITVDGNEDRPEPYAEGVRYPSVDSRIEDQIDDCESGGCEAWTSTMGDSKTYYTNDTNDAKTWTVDNPGGNVTVVINDNWEANEIEIKNLNDDYMVSVYVREDFKINGDVNVVEGDPSQLQVLVHSDGEVDSTGSGAFRGLLYAPRSECDMNGGGGADPNIEGGVICETMKINGNPNDFVYNDDIRGAYLDLNPEGRTYITYLHVTVNEVSVRSR